MFGISLPHGTVTGEPDESPADPALGDPPRIRRFLVFRLPLRRLLDLFGSGNGIGVGLDGGVHAAADAPADVSDAVDQLRNRG